MNKKINRIEVRQTAQKVAIRDEQNRRIQFAATHPTQETLGYLNTTLCGLEPGKVEENRSEYGSNKVTREKRKLCRRDWLVHLSTRSLRFCFVWRWFHPLRI